MNLIFLDIDGVLNDHKQHPITKYCSIDGVRAKRFDNLLEEVDAQFVLTSAWRYLVHGGSMSLDGLRYLLCSHSLNGLRFRGITREDVSGDNERGEQIQIWLEENNFSGKYVVIDDMDLGISKYDHPFVQTDGKVGLTDLDVDKVVSFLKEKRTLI